MDHPLAHYSVHVRYFKCFGESAQGWQRFEPINVVLGRNNSGKSSMIDLIRLWFSAGEIYDPARHGRNGTSFELTVSEPITEAVLRQVFNENVSGGAIGMNHWEYGKRFIGARAVRTFKDGTASITRIYSDPERDAPIPPEFRGGIERAMQWQFRDLSVVRIAAERDIKPETRTTSLALNASGEGVTNTIRAFITSDRLPTEEVTVGLLEDLNYIYNEDSRFDQINCLESDDGQWEIFLHEHEKGNIRLSESGSSLKTVFLTLAYLRLFTSFSSHDWTKTVFCLEEPENNLHPSLLRRLLEFLAKARAHKKFALVLTTHSPICIDWSAKRDDTQIIHVSHDGREATARVSLGYRQNRGILDDLDVRASDLLQSNGIVWVEGPSDRVYLNRWIELETQGEIKEGLHYQIMFYAGKLLFHLDGLPPDESSTLVSLLSMNRNIALVMDSDKHLGTKAGSRPRVNLNRTKRRVRDEFKSSGGLVWITDGREVENYLSLRSLRILGNNPLKDVGQFDKIPESVSFNRFNGNKIELAHAYSKIATAADLKVLDLESRVEDLVTRIRAWNALPAG